MTENPDAAERFRQRRNLEKAAAEAARTALEESGTSAEHIGTRKLFLAAAIVALLVGSGWYLLNEMRCNDRYSAISGFLFHECR